MLAYALYYPRIEPGDALEFKRGFKRIFNACGERGGPALCDCSSDSEWTIRDPRRNPEDTFFCLPRRCKCRDNSTQAIRPWASERQSK